jgi:hypothetical protein
MTLTRFSVKIFVIHVFEPQDIWFKLHFGSINSEPPQFEERWHFDREFAALICSLHDI